MVELGAKLAYKEPEPNVKQPVMVLSFVGRVAQFRDWMAAIQIVAKSKK